MSNKLEALIQRLENFDYNSVESSRIFHGRGHCFQHLEYINIDWFSPVMWVVVYGEVAPEVLSEVKEQLITLAQSNTEIKAVCFQQRLRGRSEQHIWYGELPEQLIAHELGANYPIDLSSNQNIGFFLDAKPARQWVRAKAKDKRVLNMFAYTCSFSVAALQGEAAHVVNIDMAKGPIAQGQKNHALNGFKNDRVSFLPHDIFRSMKNLSKRGPYDIIIIDPPSRQKNSFEANKDYLKLLKKLTPLMHSTTKIVALLNAPYLNESFLPELFSEALPCYEMTERLAQRDDFPEKDLSCCLKMQIFSPIQQS